MIPIITDSEIPSHLKGLGLTHLNSSTGLSIYLEYKEDSLSLVTETTKKERQKPVKIDFIKAWSRLDPSDKKGPLFKALGPNFKEEPIWDLTCGMGGDALLMLFFGAEVIAFERNPIIGALLKDAYNRALSDYRLGPIFKERFTLINQDSRKSKLKAPLIIYFDPMYEEDKRKSLQKKEMRAFREIVGEDQDAQDVLKWALNFAKGRVVVKRSLRGKELLNGLNFSQKGKSTRYDVYLINPS